MGFISRRPIFPNSSLENVRDILLPVQMKMYLVSTESANKVSNAGSG